MSAAQIFSALVIPTEKVLSTLKEVADLLCRNHTHNIAPLDIKTGEIAELYTITIDCGGDDIIWQAEMWPDCRFKTIKRCKRVSIPNISPARGSLPLLQPRRTWNEDLCNEILQLIHVTGPERNWWRDESVFKDNEPTDIWHCMDWGIAIFTTQASETAHPRAIQGHSMWDIKHFLSAITFPPTTAPWNGFTSCRVPGIS
ncbi:unnamed protein product [Tuber aestivum]|uniref:Uncharacterized protein n=1 Tax=Tuber aestivum TaxID=59557 RepID=A0A292Q9L2_9PEZI|nr:unnamed protein product [Tuber aestivum]